MKKKFSKSTIIGQVIIKTPFHRVIKVFSAAIIKIFLYLHSYIFTTRSKEMIYVISPFKTGTTFLSQVFFEKKVRHEPLLYLSIKNITKNFIVKKNNLLQLDVECNGLYAGNSKVLNDTSDNVKFIYVYRDFEPWATSFVNHFSELSKKVSYNWILRDHFDSILGCYVDRYLYVDDKEKCLIIMSLWEYWVSTIEELLENNSEKLFVNVSSLDNNLHELEDFTGFKCSDNNAWRRMNTTKSDIGVFDHIDQELVKAKTAELCFKMFPSLK
tara:strand:+ start:855 stop:1664 length:810 start_codon:yes stop_codon:yes gene_type:complete